MVTQNFYMPGKAAQMLGISEEEVLQLIESGRLRAKYLENAASYMINHTDIVEYMKHAKDFKSIQKALNCRILLIDRDANKRDLIRMELERHPNVQVKVATSERDVKLLTDEFLPDIVVSHLAAALRAADSVSESLRRTKRKNKTYVIFYHDYPSEQVSKDPQIQHQVLNCGADEVVSIHDGVRPLVQAILHKLGMAS